MNSNGVITPDELRIAIKNLLPDDELTPADFKMTMLAFDTNRNGRIDEDEFIKCITNAREQAPSPSPMAGAPVNTISSNATPFNMDNTISSIGVVDQKADEDVEDDGQKDVKKLVLRVIFACMKVSPSNLKHYQDENLSLLDLYWSKAEDVQIDKKKFIYVYSYE